MNQKPSGPIAVLQGGVLSLPASFKRQLGKKTGRAFVVEEHKKNLLLKPFEIELYSWQLLNRIHDLYGYFAWRFPYGSFLTPFYLSGFFSVSEPTS